MCHCLLSARDGTQLATGSLRETWRPLYPEGLTTALHLNPDTPSATFSLFHKARESGKDDSRESEAGVSPFPAGALLFPRSTSGSSSSATSSYNVGSSAPTDLRAPLCATTQGGFLREAPDRPLLLTSRSRELPGAAYVHVSSLACLPSCSGRSGESLGARGLLRLDTLSDTFPPGDCAIPSVPAVTPLRVTKADGPPDAAQCAHRPAVMSASSGLDGPSSRHAPLLPANALASPTPANLSPARGSQTSFPGEQGLLAAGPPRTEIGRTSPAVEQASPPTATTALAGVSLSLPPGPAVSSPSLSPSSASSCKIPACPQAAVCSTAQPLSCPTQSQSERTSATEMSTPDHLELVSDSPSSLSETVQSRQSLATTPCGQNACLFFLSPRKTTTAHPRDTNEKDPGRSRCEDTGGIISGPNTVVRGKDLTALLLPDVLGSSPLLHTDRRGGDRSEAKEDTKGTDQDGWKRLRTGDRMPSCLEKGRGSTAHQREERSSDRPTGAVSTGSTQGQGPSESATKGDGHSRQIAKVRKELERLAGDKGCESYEGKRRENHRNLQTSVKGAAVLPGNLPRATEESEEKSALLGEGGGTEELGEYRWLQTTGAGARAPGEVKRDAESTVARDRGNREAREEEASTAEEKPLHTRAPEEDPDNSGAQAWTAPGDSRRDAVGKGNDEESQAETGFVVVFAGEREAKDKSCERTEHELQSHDAEEIPYSKAFTTEAEEPLGAARCLLEAEAKETGDEANHERTHFVSQDRSEKIEEPEGKVGSFGQVFGNEGEVLPPALPPAEAGLSGGGCTAGRELDSGLLSAQGTQSGDGPESMANKDGLCGEVSGSQESVCESSVVLAARSCTPSDGGRVWAGRETAQGTTGKRMELEERLTGEQQSVMNTALSAPQLPRTSVGPKSLHQCPDTVSLAATTETPGSPSSSDCSSAPLCVPPFSSQQCSASALRRSESSCSAVDLSLIALSSSSGKPRQSPGCGPSAVSFNTSSCSPSSSNLVSALPAGVSFSCALPPSPHPCSSLLGSPPGASYCASPSALEQALSFLQPCPSCFVRLFPLGRPLAEISMHCRIQRQHILQPNVRKDVLSAHSQGCPLRAASLALGPSSAADDFTGNRRDGWWKVQRTEGARYYGAAGGRDVPTILAGAAAAAAGTADWLLSDDEAYLGAGNLGIPGPYVEDMCGAPITPVGPSHSGRPRLASFCSRYSLPFAPHSRRPHSSTVPPIFPSPASLASKQGRQRDKVNFEETRGAATGKLEALPHRRRFLRPGEAYFCLYAEKGKLQDIGSGLSSQLAAEEATKSVPESRPLAAPGEGEEHSPALEQGKEEDSAVGAPALEALCSLPPAREVSFGEADSRAVEQRHAAVPDKREDTTSGFSREPGKETDEKTEDSSAQENVSAEPDGPTTHSARYSTSVSAVPGIGGNLGPLSARMHQAWTSEDEPTEREDDEVATAMKEARRLCRRRQQYAETARISRSMKLLYKALEEVQQENLQLMETLSKCVPRPYRQQHPEEEMEADRLTGAGAERNPVWGQGSDRQLSVRRLATESRPIVARKGL